MPWGRKDATLVKFLSFGMAVLSVLQSQVENGSTIYTIQGKIPSVKKGTETESVMMQMKSKNLIVLLTHNRPKTLKRCISVVIQHSKMALDAHWIVIDDSDAEYVPKNLSVLRDFAGSGLKITHIPKSKRLEILKIMSAYMTEKNDHQIIFEKPYHRDISGLRNFGLFLNFVFKSDLTFFMDDDMISCAILSDSNDETCYFDHVNRNYVDSENHIIGSTIVGILDESYIGRFTFLVNQNMNSIFEQDHGLNYSDNDWNFEKNPLWINSVEFSSSENIATHTSAGLFGFKLNSNSVVPFPSGYNEDWNWCLLQMALHGTKVNIAEQKAFHSPPSYFKPKQDGILWEMFGECIFEFILQVIRSERNSNNDNLPLTLKDIEAKITPDEEVKRKLSTLDSLISNVEKRLENYSQLQRQELKSNLDEIKWAQNILKNYDMSSFVSQWFNNLSKRNRTFSSIINSATLCKHVRDSLEFVTQKEENVMT